MSDDVENENNLDCKEEDDVNETDPEADDLEEEDDNNFSDSSLSSDELVEIVEYPTQTSADEQDALSSIDDDEIDQLLEQGLAKSKRVDNTEQSEGEIEYNEKEIIVLEEKSKNTLEVLPGGWIEVRHSSGMPLYLHRKTRICTLAKPYFLGPGSVRRHSIPLSAIPCLAYRRDTQNHRGNVLSSNSIEASCPVGQVGALSDSPTPIDEIGSNGTTDNTVDTKDDSSASSSKRKQKDEAESIVKRAKLDDLNILPLAKVATAKENHSMHSITPDELREYCKAVFKFKSVKCKRFKTWSARRKHTKEQKRLQLQRPTMPEGVKLISFPIHNGEVGESVEGGRVSKEYIMNPQGKSSVCILHEYVQHALKKQPSYVFRELENAATPYAATVVINNMQYGTGYGSSKKQAKADAAKSTLEILIPQMKEQLNGNKTDAGDFDILLFFEPYGLLDVGIAKVCKNFSELPPYGLLLNCLQRNFGQETSNNVKFEMIATGTQSNKFRMTASEHVVEVLAPNKREGKQLASQHLLALLHPHIRNFGAFVKLYGNSSIKSVKEKKQEEQQITTLQSKASANSPNWAILKKLKAEMQKLQKQTPSLAVVPIPIADKADTSEKRSDGGLNETSKTGGDTDKSIDNSENDLDSSLDLSLSSS